MPPEHNGPFPSHLQYIPARNRWLLYTIRLFTPTMRDMGASPAHAVELDQL